MDARGYYLSIRKWVPRFDARVDEITRLVVWIRIPYLNIEYFDKRFLQIIGQKVGKVLRIDSTTAKAKRGQFARLSVEADLTKPLLSKFRLDGKIWPIQYKGLRMLCFTYGKVGHTSEGCGKKDKDKGGTEETSGSKATMDDLQYGKDFGDWMLPKKFKKRNLGPMTKPPQDTPEREI